MPGTVMERTTEQVTVLREARLERGWSLMQLVRLLWAEAERQEVRIGTHPDSVKSLLIDWEKGRRTPRPVYVRLLTAVYETTAAALELPEPFTFSLDSEQLADLFADYHGFVRGWLYRRLDDWHLADDLASEAFIKAGEALARDPEAFATLDNPYRFLACQARWALSEYYHYRRPKHEQFFEVYEDGSTRDWPATDELSCPEETVTGALGVLDLLDGLSSLEQAVVVLRCLDGLTVAEVAKRVQLSTTHTGRLLRRALSAMQHNAVVAWTIPGAVRELERAA